MGVVGSGPLVSRKVGGRFRARVFGPGRFRGVDKDGESVFDSPLSARDVLVELISSFNIQAHSHMLTGSNDHQDGTDGLGDATSATNHLAKILLGQADLHPNG